jgi:hypothetical protein
MRITRKLGFNNFLYSRIIIVRNIPVKKTKNENLSNQVFGIRAVEPAATNSPRLCILSRIGEV